MDKYTDELLFATIKKAVELGIVENKQISTDTYMKTYDDFKTLICFILEQTN